MTNSLAVLSAAVLLGGAVLTGCASGSNATPTTVFVTETGTVATSGSDASSPAVTVSALPTESGATETSTTQTSESAASSSSAESVAPMDPVVSLDPLKSDCKKIMNNTELGKNLGTLPAGTGRLLEAATPDRQITGRLKCQYGVSDDASSVALTIVLTDFESQAAAESQMALTAESEETAGAVSSKTTIQGHPANILLRDGGLLSVGYDTWTLSAVVENGILTDDKLPAALTDLADFTLSAVISTRPGG